MKMMSLRFGICSGSGSGEDRGNISGGGNMKLVTISFCCCFDWESDPIRVFYIVQYDRRRRSFLGTRYS
jgi:hypothetical protein